MAKWTREQQMAIETRNHRILVSAAAGSGKTAVLIERIVQLVKEGASLERMLIITFTRAAAGEMRQRLSVRLMKEAQTEPMLFGKALDELESADISTIHVFCQKVLKAEFQVAGIDPLARICETQLGESLFVEAYRCAMNELLEQVYAAKDEQQAEKMANFKRLTDSFSQQQLMDMASELYHFLMSMPDPFRWLHEQIDKVDMPIEEHPWYQAMVEQVRLELAGLPMLVEKMARMLLEPDSVPVLQKTVDADRITVEKLMKLCQGSTKLMLEALCTTDFVRAETCRGIDEAQKAWKKNFDAARKDMKSMVVEAADALMVDEAAVLTEMKTVQSCLRGLEQLLICLHEHFRTLKNSQNVVDFNDLEQLTLEVFRHEDSCKAWQQRYDHIFVDECQDVSAVQDAMIQAVHGENCCLFMVGDVKQSIYRFRLADPTLFLHRMRTYSDDENAENRRIFLQKNFRSRTNVLDATNRVFRRAMKASVTELDYLPEDELTPGRDTDHDPAVEIRLVERKEASGDDTLQAESNLVVKRIRQLLQTRFDDQGTERFYQYRDMVILLQKKAGMGARLAEMLQQQGVPVYFDGSDNYFGLPEIRTVKSLLMVIDNPMQDIALLTTLKSLAFSLTDSDLADIRRAKMGNEVPMHEAFEACCEGDGPLNRRCREIREQLQTWHFMQESMRLPDFLWYLLRETGFYASCGSYPEGELRQANLRLLCQKAADYESRQNGGLNGFLQMIDLEMQLADTTAAKTLGENENLVRIMTMHKSKGLEFPVVFLMRTTGNMSGMHKGNLRRHNRLGVCLPYVNPELNISRETIGDKAIKYAVQRDEMAERCRLLYVAMTRAREMLIMTGCCEGKGNDSWYMPDSAFRVSQAKSMIDWVMQSVCDDEGMRELCSFGDGEPWQVTLEPDEPVEQQMGASAMDLQAWLADTLQQAPSGNALPWWQNEPVSEAAQPIKTSVSSLTRQQVLHDPMPMTDAEEEAEDKRRPEDVVMPLRLSELPSRPAFMEEKRMTGAERGTLMHRFLSMADLEALRCGTEGLRQAVEQQLERMIQLQCFAEQQMGPREAASLTRFYASELGQRMLRSKNVRREWSFNLCLDEQQGTLLQGVIDCVFTENGNWILLDYKTDRFTDDQAFIMRHQMQLSWYARALEKITGRKVAEAWLYSLSHDQAYPVNLLPVGE